MAFSLPCAASGAFACSRLLCHADPALLVSCLLSLLVFAALYLRSRNREDGPQYTPFTSTSAGDREEDDETEIPLRKTATVPPLQAAVEGLLLLIDLVLALLLFLHGEKDDGYQLGFASTISSAYILTLLVGRVYTAKFGLKWHSICLYAAQWLYTLLLTYTNVSQRSHNRFNIVAAASRLSIFTFIGLVHCLVPRIPPHALDRGSNPPSRDELASLLSSLTFSWMDQLVWAAFRKTLQPADLGSLNRQYSVAVVLPWFQRKTSPSWSLLWRIFSAFKYRILLQGLWAALNSLAVFVSPMLIHYILQDLNSRDANLSRLWTYVGGLLVSGMLATLAECQCNWTGSQMNARMRIVLVSEIYAKVLRKSTAKGDEGSSGNSASTGTITNLMSVDAQLVSSMSSGLYFIWIVFPVQMGLGTYLLYRLLGISGILGVLAMILLVPLNILVSRGVMATQGQVLTASDARIQASNELLDNIYTIKFCAWEAPFRSRILQRRGIEMQRMRTRCIWWTASMTLFHTLPFLVTILPCFFYTIVWGQPLGTAIAFPALAIFAVLRIPINRLADSITFLIQAYISLIRISRFLDEEETNKYRQLSDSHDLRIGFDDATFTWPTTGQTNNLTNKDMQSDDEDEEDIPLVQTTEPFRLRRLHIQFQPGGLNVICGASGSGKSSLLLALLGEMNLVGGRLLHPYPTAHYTDYPRQSFSMDTLSNATAYCPQEPWIMNRSIRANIVLDLPFDSTRYETVLHAVDLQPDLALFDYRDDTLAGENGSRLSGGQKQRVALARALYSPCRYMLLDDCLSALDSRTANHIFRHAITGLSMRGRTCILATHHTQLAVPNCKWVVLLEAGRVKAQGTAKELVSRGLINNEILQDHATNTTPADTASGDLAADDETPKPSTPTKPDGQRSYTESRPEGAVGWPVVRTYLVAMGGWNFWVPILVGFIIQQLAALGTNLWIKEWASQYDSRQKMGPTAPTVAASYYIMIYGIICLGYAGITFIRDLGIFFGALKASGSIYKTLLDAILYAKFTFFDSTPLGQITNRLSKDVEVLDQLLVKFSISMCQLATSLAMVVIFIGTVLPGFMIAAIFIFLAYWLVIMIYIHGARDLKRIENTERSPLYQQFGETLAGYVSIRAYSYTAAFIEESQRLIDRQTRPFLLLSASSGWLSLRVGTLSSLIMFLTGVFILWDRKSVSPGAAGLVLTFAASITENVMWLVQVYAIIQQNLSSLERVIEYTKIEQEPVRPLKSAVDPIPSAWPSKGTIVFHNYTARYAPELEPALQDINFTVHHSERVGIVGRTGAGKSTLTMALIRGIEACSGYIEINGVDIASVTLHELRRAVTVVPQDPWLFAGSLRDNLAPLKDEHLYSDEAIYSDEALLNALRTVRLFPESNISSADLDRPAETLSRGQRQLLCIARGLLRRSRVLVLDEATASVDHATDAAIRSGLRASVHMGTTVLTIAHRILSIADYDRVVVLDEGRVVEEGRIRDLLSRRGQDARFRRMCEESGDFKEIERLAASRTA
ncbi:canalicular multispecific organic anion transporter 2 [Arthroderma uncinatum]|uniref:canalicular multispecific organic anion transporter 2 n=1 Tax=Arthroderma uncinatum TaxID=74035 RepID=UPI00144A85B1|nr:canalicular multispecific organic anion transporter 2 [Arthroderma uncinatum]KAF3484393.1 canalicular multispecific organic anion transporter 2 [Arthroderma uncinatum]